MDDQKVHKTLDLKGHLITFIRFHWLCLQDLVADFACACPPGYTGKNCSMDIDECQEVGCPGNSTCMDSIDDFTCVCNPGYTGQNCTEGTLKQKSVINLPLFPI